MLKRIKRSIQRMPRSAYIFLKNSLILCDTMLFSSLVLFMSSNGMVESFERTKMAQLMLESPVGVLLLTLIGLVFILDRS